MGVHFTVTVDHDLQDNSLSAVRDRFEPLQPIMAEISTRYKRSDVWRDISEPGGARPNLFYMPGGFTLHLGPAALNLHHVVRFRAFIELGPELELLRRLSRDLAGLFNQPKVLYAPCEGIGDKIVDWMTDGLSVSDMESRLGEQGSPPGTIKELTASSGAALRCYIDEFEDLGR